MKNEELYKHIRKMLEVFQICDSTFPIGTFNHSYGMETYLRENKINDNNSFKKWMEIFLKTQFKWGEGLLVKLTMEALKCNNINKVWQYDQKITRSNAAIETRKGARLIAEQMIILVLKIYGKDNSPEIKLIKEYQERIKKGESFGNPAIVFAMFMVYEGLNEIESVSYYGYSIVTTMIQNAVRAIPLGQKSGQKIMHDLFSDVLNVCQEILKMDEKLLGANVPGIELAQINHETTIFRLFMS